MSTLSRRAFLTGAALVGASTLIAPELWTPSRTFFLPPKGGWIPHGVNYAYPIGDIRRYGAIGDGITDCAQAFAEAFEHVDRVYVPAGQFLVLDTIRLPPGRPAELIGFGTGSQLLSVRRTPIVSLSENHVARNLYLRRV